MKTSRVIFLPVLPVDSIRAPRLCQRETNPGRPSDDQRRRAGNDRRASERASDD